MRKEREEGDDIKSDFNENDKDQFDLMQVFIHTDETIRRFHLWKQRQDGTNPHRGQGKLLIALKHNPGITQNKLCEMLGIRQQSLGETLLKLEKKEYIIREHSEDRRTMKIDLTPAGLEATPKKTDPNEIFGCLSQEEQLLFQNYLERIETHLNATMAED